MGRAVFLDRDGTLVEPRHYPSEPHELVLYDGIAEDLRRLQAAGFALIVITNQSGIARGLFDTAALDRMHRYLRQKLLDLGVRIDAFYYCPHHPEGIVPDLAHTCNCRKPAPGMLLRAAVDFNLDLRSSWFVGDILDDVEAGNRAGCRTILVDLGTEPLPNHPLRQPTAVARKTRHALAIIASAEGLGPITETTYAPDRWASVAQT